MDIVLFLKETQDKWSRDSLSTIFPSSRLSKICFAKFVLSEICLVLVTPTFEQQTQIKSNQIKSFEPNQTSHTLNLHKFQISHTPKPSLHKFQPQIIYLLVLVTPTFEHHMVKYWK